MKTKLCILFMMFFGAVNSQAPSYLWAHSSGGNDGDGAYSCSTDVNGNTFVTGSFQSDTIQFGTFTLLNSDTTTNNIDMFIAKYDPTGNVLWAQSAGRGLKNDYGTSCSVDAGGNVFVTGYFQSDSITFGAFTLANASLDIDMYVVKYDPNGIVLWAKRGGGIVGEYAMSCSADPGGNVFVVGSFGSQSATFGTVTLIDTNMTGTDMFIVKYDPFGIVLWAKNLGGNSNDYAYGCCSDANGNVMVTGYFNSTTLAFASNTLTNTGGGDAFIVQYDANGNENWGHTSGGGTMDFGNSCCADANGNILVTGAFTSPTISFGTTTLTSGGSWDLFVVKYDPSGNVIWAKRAGGTSLEVGYGCAIDANDNVVVTGGFQSSSITFGSSTLNSNGGGMDLFVAKYDAGGNELWAQGASGSSSSTGMSCSIAPGGNIIVTGNFSTPTVIFGTITLTNGGSSFGDAFVARLDEITGVPESSFGGGINIYPNPFCTITALQTNELLCNATFTVVNSLGQTVAEVKNINGQTFIFDRENLSNGVYYFQLSQNNKVIAADRLIITD